MTYKIPSIIVLLMSLMKGFSQPVYYPGISIDDFRALMPKRIPEHLRVYDSFQKDTEINGIKGKWSFDIRSDVLKTVEFNSMIHIVPWQSQDHPEEFTKTYEEAAAEAEKIIDYYTEKYGKPDVKKSKPFKADDFSSRELMNYQWQLNNMNISLHLKFLGDSPEAYNMPNAEMITYKFYTIVDFSENYNDKAPESKELVYPGMNVTEFAKAFPEFFPYGVVESGQSNFRNRLHGLDGYWYYSFKNDTLDNYGYYFSLNKRSQLNEENFQKCLKSTQEIIDDYTGYYGTPDSLFEGNTKFVDPDMHRHWGYNVIEARWLEKNQKIKVGFEFFGGKGQYFFCVTVKVFKRDYPYFD